MRALPPNNYPEELPCETQFYSSNPIESPGNRGLEERLSAGLRATGGQCRVTEVLLGGVEASSWTQHAVSFPAPP
ncbi:hypothetical protein Q7C36_004881 [Tachysurus vachellii]|uniref:Uncharacterized protein n=1 Tax=Tachysurus vachellii TaxID=175792 RepID=A0AA88T215_TACVA|nr:hypothetical protein Q7C36_004881 [Tachysurus vachellii]